MPTRGFPVSDKRFRPPSAYKHGSFSKTVLFPWEDADEFDALHRSLQDEWEPSGAPEEDDLLRRMAEASVRPEIIATNLNRTVHAVKARAYMIGLPLKWFKLKAKGEIKEALRWNILIG